LSLPANAAMNDAAQTLYDRMVNAYQNTQTYQATVQYIKSEHDGRWQLMQQLQVAFDRSSGSLLFDRPDMLLVSSEGYLRYRSDMIPGRHLQVKLDRPIDALLLKSKAPFLVRQIMPDVRMLLGGSPIEPGSDVKAVDADSQGRPGLQWTNRDGLVTLRLNPHTALIESTTIERQAIVQRASHVGPAKYSYTITVNRHNEQFAREWFAFDTANSQPVSNWSSLLGTNDVDAMAMEEQLAPAISLSDQQHNLYLLNREEADVVVLTFWASWGGPPVYQTLPILQRLSDWAQREGKSVSVKTVNMREDEQTIKQVWEVKQLTLPVLMDTNAQVAHAYCVGAIPQTVVIANGMVRHVHVGSPADFETVLRAQVNGLLQKPVSVTRK
jgi:peroxiredoxin